MLSTFSRRLTYLNAALYAVLGSALFLFPNQFAPVFAWKVTHFMTMSIGGWCLGNAWNAYLSARRWSWSLVYLSLRYMWLFGLLEMAVLINFRDKLTLAHPIAQLYAATLVVNAASALIGISDLWRIRPPVERVGALTTPLQFVLTIGFIIFVSFLGLYGMSAPIGAPGTNGGIFPELISPFTLRSFGAFYLCIALAVIPSLIQRNLQSVLHHFLAQYGLIVFITLAAFVNLPLFDFGARPGGLLYFGAYLLVGVVVLVMMLKQGTGKI